MPRGPLEAKVRSENPPTPPAPGPGRSELNACALITFTVRPHGHGGTTPLFAYAGWREASEFMCGVVWRRRSHCAASISSALMREG